MTLKLWFTLSIGMLIGASLLEAQPQRAAISQTSPKKTPPPQGTTAQEDRQIEAAIRVKLDKSKIGKDGFKVRVQGGVATWEASTDVLQHKGAATCMAGPL